VRVQDRTGILWVLDSAALDEVLPADERDHPDGLEVVGGHPTGVLRRLDHWLGHRVPTTPVDLGAVGAELVARGVVGVTDAGATNGPADVAALAAADLPLHVAAMTGPVDVEPAGAVALGPVKVLLDDADLPPLDDLTARVASAHATGRAVAVHCVTEVQLALGLAAGLGPHDRVEHASFVPPDLLRALVAAGPQVVVQPGLVWSRGDRYLDQVDPADHGSLHRLASFRDAGLRVALSSDAPYGPVDPWRAVAAATSRRTSSGQVLGADEAVDPLAALAMLTGRLDDPSSPRVVAPGHPADVVVLDAAWDDLADLAEADRPVVATVVGGQVVHGRWPG
jgi:predicted amidohydrolase YtcJ